jgi:hypothetical protein
MPVITIFRTWLLIKILFSTPAIVNQPMKIPDESKDSRIEEIE